MTQNTDNVLDYAHLITTRPHDISRVIVSDLHLSNNEPALVQAFLALLNDLIVLPSLTELYILGDWFDAWIGDDAYLSLTDDDKQHHWLTPIVNTLQALKAKGCDILVMHGNRDFLIGQAFCDTFNGILIDEPYLTDIGSQQFRLEHGDALCTDDISYQRFRNVMRNPIVQWLLLRQSLDKRVALAKKIRQKSMAGKASKSQFIMDVNEQSVNKAIRNVDALLHGHTHRPAVHLVENVAPSKTRYVLGDWRVMDSNKTSKKVEAVIGMTLINEELEQFKLVKFKIQEIMLFIKNATLYK